MAFIPVPDTALVEIRGTYFGQEIENTLYFEKVGGYISADLADLAALVRAWFFDEMLPILTEDYIFREVVATDISTESGAIVFNTAETGETGAIASPGMPGNVCLAVSFRTGQAGRSYRGRNFISGLTEAAVDGNTLNETYRTAFGAAYSALLTVLEDTDFVWGVVSRFTAGAPRVVGVITQIISVLVVDAFIDSQRRRLTGRGQ